MRKLNIQFELNIPISHSFPSLKFTIFLSLLSQTVLSTLLILALCRTRVTTNSVNMTSLATSLPVAQWLERPTGVREVMVSIPVGDQIFSLSHACDKLNIPLSHKRLCFVI